MQTHLTELQRTEQQSLLTCCQLLEGPWDFSLGSPSSVVWRLSILESRSSSKSSRINLTKSIKAHCLGKIILCNFNSICFHLYFLCTSICSRFLVLTFHPLGGGSCVSHAHEAGIIQHRPGVRGLKPVNIWQLPSAQWIRCLY